MENFGLQREEELNSVVKDFSIYEIYPLRSI